MRSVVARHSTAVPVLYNATRQAVSEMRITLIVSSLARGGAQRVLSLLANCWAEQGRQVTLLTVDRDDPPAYPLHPAIKLQEFGLPWPSSNIIQGVFRNLHRIQVLRRAIRESQPDIVISFMDRTNVLVLLATRGLGKPVIVCERTDPRRYDIGWLWQRLRLLTYPFADALMCQTSATLAWFQERLRVRGYVIPNPVVVPPAGLTERCQPDRDTRDHVIVAMGRLVPEKGFDLLLSAFARVAGSHPAWRLEIFGEGPLKAELEVQAQSLGVQDRVTMAGALSDPFSRLRSADLFVLSSRLEGFPNALCEAMACGLGVVSFDCSPAIAEIIRDGLDGILVPPEDVDALAAVLNRVMADPAERRKLAARAPEVLSRFSKGRILDLWERMFEELAPGAVGKGGGRRQAMSDYMLEQPARSDSQ